MTAGACADFANAPDSAPGLQALAYQYDAVGNILGLRNTLAVPPPNQYGGPSRQSFVYDDLYRLTSAQGRYRFNPGKTRTYQLDLAYDSIHNILSKQQADVVNQPSGTPVTQQKTSYAWTYEYAPSGTSSVRPHAPIHIGSRTYSYDANGNQLGWDHDANGTRRTLVWDEENRIQSVFDNGHEKFYKYDDQGERVIKRGPQGETVYVNQYFTLRNREVGTKHVYVGQTRAVSKLMKQDKPGANPQGKTPVEKDLYYFHPDHLGSSNLITDAQGQAYEHLEYFPFGETWVEESTNTQRTPYLFTGKELDEETGLYYFGARYYDPRTSVWQSADPILGKYLPSANRPGNQRLPGMGGVFNSYNLGMYGYGYQNPIKLVDPDGNAPRIKIPKGGISQDAYDLARANITPRNMRYAGGTYKGVPFTRDGYPDFSKFLYKGDKGNPEVTIPLTGSRALDEKLANARGGFNETPEGYVWHHHQDNGKMQLVEKGPHDSVGHTGGFGILKKAATIMGALVSGVANASPQDWAEFGLDMALGWMSPTEMGNGSLYGPGTDFPDYQSYQSYHQKLEAMKQERQAEQSKGQ